MTVLVTGGAGLIGSHIVDRVLERGQNVRILDNLDPQTHPKGRPPWIPRDADFVEGDVRDTDLLARVLDGVEEIYHQAAFGGFTSEISTYFDANSTGTARIFEVIAERRLTVRKIVAASSQAIYGEGLYMCEQHGDVQPGMRTLERLLDQLWEPVCPVCERDVRPTLTHENASWNSETPYAISKLAEERTVVGMGKRLDIPVVALRYAVTFGPRQSVFNPYTGIVSIFSTLLLNDIPAVVYEDGLQTRDFIYVGDIARANVLAMDDDRANGRVFNVGRGEPVTVLQLIEELSHAYGREPNYRISGEFRPGDVRHLVHDASAIRALGWKPETTLADGLARVAEWIGSQGALKEYYSDALAKLRERGVVQSARAPAQR